MRTQQEINDLLASIRSGLSRGTKQGVFSEQDAGWWKIVIAILEWVNGADNSYVDDIKNGL